MTPLAFFRAAAAKTADLLWPRVCVVPDCGRPSDRPGRHLCSRCLAVLPWHEAGGACRVCGAPVAADVTFDFVCDLCRGTRPAYEFARSAVRYEAPADTLIGDFKYRRKTWLREDLTDLLEGTVRAKLEAAAVDVVIPVPLHPNRLRERGFNQSALLARSLAQRLCRRFDDAALARIRDTPHQARINGEARLENVKDAFSVRVPARVRGRTVLLIDDVMTTGATLSDCARALLDGGAERVWCATVARSVLS